MSKILYNKDVYGDAKEEIRSKLAIEDVVGEYVDLKRSGRYWKGLSPFTNEKTPSFFVTPDKDIWHDFSSGKGGDIFSFIMEMEGVDFRGALEILARKAGVDLTKYQSAGVRSNAARKERYYQMNDMAVNYYQHQLLRSTEAMNYVFKKRQLSKKTVMEWGIGYAPLHSGALEKILTDKKYTKREMSEVGLLGYSGRELFFDRMMIPLRDRKGQVVGFTGRIIGDGQPKYLNTPDTLLYHKGRQLFGLNFAARAIRQQGFSVIVEGNLDVITSHQAGIKNVVGVAGTALTAEHLKSLSRLSNDIRFCFDSDKAGVAATERAIKLAGPLELKLSVIDYSGLGAKDPDELIHQNPKLWRDALKKHQSAVNWVRDYYIKTIGTDTVEGKKVVADKTLDVIMALSDPVEREGYIRELSKKTDISVSALIDRQKQLKDQGEQKSRRHKQAKVKKVDASKISRDNKFNYIDNILAYLLMHQQLRQRYLTKIPDEQLSSSELMIKKILLASDISSEELINRLSAQMDAPGADLDKLDKLRNKLSGYQIIGDNANNAIEGIKTERDLLDYICHFEHGYYLNRANKLFTQAMNVSPDSPESAELAEAASKARKTAQLLEPSANRRNNYQGLAKYWQAVASLTE